MHQNTEWVHNIALPRGLVLCLVATQVRATLGPRGAMVWIFRQCSYYFFDATWIRILGTYSSVIYKEPKLCQVLVVKLVVLATPKFDIKIPFKLEREKEEWRHVVWFVREIICSCIFLVISHLHILYYYNTVVHTFYYDKRHGVLVLILFSVQEMTINNITSHTMFSNNHGYKIITLINFTANIWKQSNEFRKNSTNEGTFRPVQSGSQPRNKAESSLRDLAIVRFRCKRYFSLHCCSQSIETIMVECSC